MAPHLYRLTTPRLTLDELSDRDVPALARLAGDRAVADTTISIPHPLDEPTTLAWLQRIRAGDAAGHSLHLAVRHGGGAEPIGVVALREIDREHEQAEISFWIGRPFWGRGLATEAVAAVVDHGFRALSLNRIFAYHMVRNPASARVLERVGLRQEGLLRQRVKKWGIYEDVVLRAVLRADWCPPS